MAAIDVGYAAIDRDSSGGGGYTMINMGNLANLGGTITSVEIWAKTNITGLRVGSFYLIPGNYWKCRASATIGSVTGGSKQTFTAPTDFVAFAIQPGDGIGCYFATGEIEVGTTGGTGSGWGNKLGEFIDPGDWENYTTYADYAMSLYGIGTGEGLPLSVTTQAVTSIAATTATGNGNITSFGFSAVTQHGHCWNTTGAPTTSSSKTQNGVPSGVGVFTSSLTGLTSGVHYYVKAYAMNTEGTAYGNETEFTAGGQSEYFYPSAPEARATGLIHRYVAAKDVLRPLTLEVLLGGATYGTLTTLSLTPPTLPEMTQIPPSLADWITGQAPPPPGASALTQQLIQAAFVGYKEGQQVWVSPEGVIGHWDPAAISAALTKQGLTGPFADEKGTEYWLRPTGERYYIPPPIFPP